MESDQIDWGLVHKHKGDNKMNKIMETLAKGWGLDPDHQAVQVDVLNKGLSLTNIEAQLKTERADWFERELEYKEEITRLSNVEAAILKLTTDNDQIKAARIKKQLKKEGVTIKYKDGEAYLYAKVAVPPK